MNVLPVLFTILAILSVVTVVVGLRIIRDVKDAKDGPVYLKHVTFYATEWIIVGLALIVGIGALGTTELIGSLTPQVALIMTALFVIGHFIFHLNYIDRKISI